jgi:hypothetical protein
MNLFVFKERMVRIIPARSAVAEEIPTDLVSFRQNTFHCKFSVCGRPLLPSRNLRPRNQSPWKTVRAVTGLEPNPAFTRAGRFELLEQTSGAHAVHAPKGRRSNPFWRVEARRDDTTQPNRLTHRTLFFQCLSSGSTATNYEPRSKHIYRSN